MDYKKSRIRKKFRIFFFIFKIVFGKFSALFEKNLSILEIFFFSVFVKFGVSCVMRRFSQNLVFEAVLFAREIKNLHKTKSRFQKCFLISFSRKNTEVLFPKNVNFRIKKCWRQQFSDSFHIFF